MGMGSKPNPKGDGLPADFIERVGQSFELIVTRPTFRPAWVPGGRS
jgi:hypothetical protein